MSKNGIGVAGVTALAEALSHNEALQTLSLDTNSVGDEGAEVLAKHLSGACARLHNRARAMRRSHCPHLVGPGDKGIDAGSEGPGSCRACRCISGVADRAVE